MSTASLGPDVNIGPSASIAGWCEATVAFVVVVLRLYTQIKIVGRVGLDDYLMIAALVIAMLNTSLITHAIGWGIGRHIYYLSDVQIVNAIKFEILAQAPGIIGPVLSRSSFAIFLLKFAGTSKIRKWTLWSVVITQVFVNAIVLLLIFIQCQHYSALWDPSVGGWCWSRKVQVDSGYFQGGEYCVGAPLIQPLTSVALNCIHDLILTFLPMLVLKDLNMSLRIKIVLSVLMGMSIFAFAASIVKTISLGDLGKLADFTYETIPFILWFTIEQYVVIIAASIPSLRPLLMHVKKQSSTGGSNTYAMNTYRSRAMKGYVPYGEGNDGTLKSYNNSTVVETVQSAYETPKKLPDSESEEYILPTQNPKGRITKTTNVSVMYSETGKQDLEIGS